MREMRFKEVNDFPKIVLQVCDVSTGKIREHLILRVGFGRAESLLFTEKEMGRD
jgi:hypothetical protein